MLSRKTISIVALLGATLLVAGLAWSMRATGGTRVQLECDEAFLRGAELGDEEAVKKALRRGARPAVQNHDGNTALILAAKHGSQSLAVLLLDAGVPVDQTNRAGVSALAEAGMSRNDGFLMELVLRGAKPPIPSREEVFPSSRGSNILVESIW
jgi:ankyrin repeat protein